MWHLLTTKYLSLTLLLTVFPLALAVVPPPSSSHESMTYDTSTCTWAESPEEATADLLTSVTSCSPFQSYISPTDWNANREFFAYCDAEGNIAVRARVTKLLQGHCASGDYIGISSRLLYCGTYAEVARRCSASRPGYVIINRKKLDEGEVQATACPVTGEPVPGATELTCTSITHTDGGVDCTVVDPPMGTDFESKTFKTANGICRWMPYNQGGCYLPSLGMCADPYTYWVNTYEWLLGHDFFMYCSTDGILRYRHNANKNIGDCDTADYVGISPRLFICGTMQDLQRQCNTDRGLVMLDRVKLDEGELVGQACGNDNVMGPCDESVQV